MSVVALARDVRAANRVFICGNGGSAANAMHFANDLLACGMDARALTNMATMTAVANDFGYEHIFEHQIKAAGCYSDMLIVLSGSGNSSNLLRAISAAKQKFMLTWAIVGAYTDPPGNVPRTAHRYIARGRDMQHAEEQQLVIAHGVTRWLKKHS